MEQIIENTIIDEPKTDSFHERAEAYIETAGQLEKLLTGYQNKQGVEPGLGFDVTRLSLEEMQQLISRGRDFQKRLTDLHLGVRLGDLETRKRQNISGDWEHDLSGVTGGLDSSVVGLEMVVEEDSATVKNEVLGYLKTKSAHHDPVCIRHHRRVISSFVEEIEGIDSTGVVDVRELANDIKLIMVGRSAIRKNDGGRVTEVEVDMTESKVKGKANDVYRVIYNLCNNADKILRKEEGGEPGKIWIKSEVMNGQLKISVRDSGPGLDLASIKRSALKNHVISEENLSTLNDQRTAELIFANGVSGFAEGREGGTGLGLTISRHLLEDMQGSLSLTYVPGEGANFEICLPRGE